MKKTARGSVVAIAVLLGASAFAASAPRTPAPSGCDAGKKRCIIDVKVSGSAGSYSVTFDPDTAKVPQATRGTPFILVFRLPNLFVFKPAMGDGVVMKDPDQDEFVDPHVSDDDGGTHAGTPKGWRRYVWRYLNTVDGLYHYKIQFHDTSGNVVTGDPVITNVDTH